MGTQPRQRLGAPLKRDAAAALIREKIADGTLRPGGAVPSGAALAREAGCSALTARAALRALLADGTLVQGVSRTGRLRVALAGEAGSLNVEAARAALSTALAGLRRAAGLTQPEFAAKIGVSVTTVGHAETGRVWQSQTFWLRADRELGGAGELPRLHDDLQAALAARSGPENAHDRQHAGDPGEAAAAGDDKGGCSCGACAVSVTVTFCDGHTIEMRP